MPRSQYADKFNHDLDAGGYDMDVRNENHPVRRGYAALLDWVAENCNRHQPRRILELGTGTGNLACRLNGYESLVCVDISDNMLRLAQAKLEDKPVRFVRADLLAFFDDGIKDGGGEYDAVVSSYAIHHLTEAEKLLLFDHIHLHLADHGIAVFGDLMFEHKQAGTQYLDQCRRLGQNELAEDIEDEFFWYLDAAKQRMIELDFRIEVKRFSELSWGIRAARPDS